MNFKAAVERVLPSYHDAFLLRTPQHSLILHPSSMKWQSNGPPKISEPQSLESVTLLPYRAKGN